MSNVNLSEPFQIFSVPINWKNPEEGYLIGISAQRDLAPNSLTIIRDTFEKYAGKPHDVKLDDTSHLIASYMLGDRRIVAGAFFENIDVSQTPDTSESLHHYGFYVTCAVDALNGLFPKVK